jgi:hypothetical protein
MSPVKYEKGFYIPEDDILLYSHSSISCSLCPELLSSIVNYTKIVFPIRL